MQFYLIYHGNQISAFKQFIELSDREVADTDSPYALLCIEPLQSLPGLSTYRLGPVDEIQIEIICPQTLQRSFVGSERAVIA